MRLIDADVLIKWLEDVEQNRFDKFEVEKIINFAPTIEPRAAEWIPCSERLPDNKTYVLTTIQVRGRQPHVRSGFYHDGFFHNDNGDTWRAIEDPLKAWMPLPKPCREESEVKE